MSPELTAVLGVVGIVLFWVILWLLWLMTVSIDTATDEPPRREW